MTARIAIAGVTQSELGVTGRSVYELELVRASGEGTIYSHTTVVRAPPGFVAPYVIAIVRLVEGPRLLTRITGCENEAVRCDMPVTLAWGATPRRPAPADLHTQELRWTSS